MYFLTYIFELKVHFSRSEVECRLCVRQPIMEQNVSGYIVKLIGCETYGLINKPIKVYLFLIPKWHSEYLERI